MSCVGAPRRRSGSGQVRGQRGDARWDRVGQGGQRRGSLASVPGGRTVLPGAHGRQLPGETAPCDEAQAVEVVAGTVREAACLLPQVEAGDLHGATWREPQAPRVNRQVQPGALHFAQGRGHLADDVEYPRWIERPRLHDGGERGAVGRLRHREREPVRVRDAEVEDPRYCRMAYPRCVPCCGQEAFSGGSGGGPRAPHGDRAPGRQVARPPGLAGQVRHDQLVQPIAVGQ